MTIGPVTPDSQPLRQMAAPAPRPGAQPATADVQQDAAIDAEPAGDDSVTLASDATFSAEAPTSSPMAEAPPQSMQGAGFTGTTLNEPLLMVDQPCTAETSDSGEGGKLSHTEHIALQDAAKAQGTYKVRVADAGGVEHVVNVHGASPTERKNIEKALRDLGGCDQYGLIMPTVKDIHVTDTLGNSSNGKPVMGVAVKQDDGETAITLSRMQGQASRNPIEGMNHVKEVLYHEIGHNVDNKYNMSGLVNDTYGEGDADKVGAGGDFITKYATTSRKEDYAETFSSFYVGRSYSGFEGCSDQEVIDMTLLGDNGQGTLAAKMRAIPQDLSPQVAVKAHVTDYVVQNPERGGRHVVRDFYDDPQFRLQLVDDIGKKHPNVPREAIYDYMSQTAELFGETPVPNAPREPLSYREAS